MTKVIEQWDVFEQEFFFADAQNPYLDVSLDAVFSCGTASVQVDGFYDGDDIYKIRLMPDQPGTWSYTMRSNVPALDGHQGTFICTPASPGNHGPVQVAEKVHFAYADGTPYYPVGTTCYVWNLQGSELEEQTLKTLDSAPFNKLRMCVFPKRYLFNNNEPPLYPFSRKADGDSPELTWDFEYFNPDYFRHLETRIKDLCVRGIEADLIIFHSYDNGAWGFDKISSDTRVRLLKYLVARLASFRNLWWSFANEFDFLYHITTEEWDREMKLVMEIDPYNHLRSIHNGAKFYDHRKPWVTHCSIQNHNLHQVRTWMRKYGKPVVVDECGYEGDIHMNWGDLSPEEMVVRFWLGFTLGGYVGHGETYFHDQDLLWWSKGGQLSGESPTRIAFLRKIFEDAPGVGLLPLKEDFTVLGPEDEVFSPPESEVKIVPDGFWNVEAGGYCGTDYFLFYFGMHQPRLRNFELPDGRFRVDIIDTWNMTIENFSEKAEGNISVTMPGRKYMAIRIQRIE